MLQICYGVRYYQNYPLEWGGKKYVIVHRDLKLANINVWGDLVKISDFGIATLAVKDGGVEQKNVTAMAGATSSNSSDASVYYTGTECDDIISIGKIWLKLIIHCKNEEYFDKVFDYVKNGEADILIEMLDGHEPSVIEAIFLIHRMIRDKDCKPIYEPRPTVDEVITFIESTLRRLKLEYQEELFLPEIYICNGGKFKPYKIKDFSWSSKIIDIKVHIEERAGFARDSQKFIFNKKVLKNSDQLQNFRKEGIEYNPIMVRICDQQFISDDVAVAEVTLLSYANPRKTQDAMAIHRFNQQIMLSQLSELSLD